MTDQTTQRVFLLILCTIYESKNDGRVRYRKPRINYPKDSFFFATDFFVRGCRNFLERCPKVYKTQPVCGRSYAGDFKDFANYCEMQYENCNSWKNWVIFKREKC